MASEPQLKIKLNADTSGYQKGMQASKQEVRDLESVSSNALGSIAGALGINAGKVQQLTNAFTGLAGKLAEMGTSGKAAFAGLELGAGALTTAIAAVPIAALVAGFKSLNDEADYFMSLADNDWMKAGSDAFKDAFKGAMHDLNADAAGEWAELRTGFTETMTVAAGTVKQIFSGLFSNEDGPGAAIADAFANSKQARQTAEQARAIAIELDNMNDSMSGWQLEWQKANTQIEKYRGIARDTTQDQQTREKALQDAEAAINALYADQNFKLGQRAYLMDQLNGLTSSTQEQVDAVNRAYSEAEASNTRREQQLASLNRLRSSIYGHANATTGADKATNKELDKMLEKVAALNEADIFKDLRLSSDTAIAAIETPGNLLGQATTGITVPIKFDREQIQKAVVDLTDMLQESVVSVSTVVGELIGDLVTGGDAWENFGNAAMSAFADMAISVGKIAIATGFAASGIKQALTLNPTAAIVAGAALVALGAAVKAGLSNAGRGSAASYGSTSVASSGYGTSQASAYGRTLTVEVQGTLTANGSKLVAVLNNENNRTNYTT